MAGFTSNPVLDEESMTITYTTNPDETNANVYK